MLDSGIELRFSSTSVGLPVRKARGHEAALADFQAMDSFATCRAGTSIRSRQTIFVLVDQLFVVT